MRFRIFDISRLGNRFVCTDDAQFERRQSPNHLAGFDVTSSVENWNHGLADGFFVVVRICTAFVVSSWNHSPLVWNDHLDNQTENGFVHNSLGRKNLQLRSRCNILLLFLQHQGMHRCKNFFFFFQEHDNILTLLLIIRKDNHDEERLFFMYLRFLRT